MLYILIDNKVNFVIEFYWKYNQNRGDLMPFFLDNTFIDDLLYEFNFDKME